MEEKETINEDVKEYIDTKLDLIKLKAIDKAGSAISGIIFGVVIAFLAIFLLLFLSLSAAYTLAEITGKNSIGFILIAAFYLFATLILIVFKEKIITVPVINMLIKKYFSTDESTQASEQNK